ncbi:MAG: exodeoxyribonuclease VII large subunit [Hyphomicrobiaceae bacterium]
MEGLARIAGQRRLRLARVAGRLSPVSVAERLSRACERLEGHERRLIGAFSALVARRRQRLEAQGQLLATLSYHSVLGRGFALVRDADGRAVRSVGGLPAGSRIDIEVADGHRGAVVAGDGQGAGDDGREAGSAEGRTERLPASALRQPADVRVRPTARGRGGTGRDSGGQGSLF